MKTQVTVVVEDSLIIVNGAAYTFDDLTLPENVQNLVGSEQAQVHALQWVLNGEVGKGDIEFKDLDVNDSFVPVNRSFNEDEYEIYVQPFVDMWEAEKARLEEIANTPPTLEEAKTAKTEEINAKRDSLEQSGFEYNGHIYDSDTLSYNRLVGASLTAQVALASGQDMSIDWTTQNNEVVTLSAQELVEIIPAFALYSNALHQKASELKAQANAAETVEAVQAVVWAVV